MCIAQDLNSLCVSRIPRDFGNVSWNDNGPDGMISSHLNFVFTVELEEVRSAVGKFERHLRLSIGTHIIVLVW